MSMKTKNIFWSVTLTGVLLLNGCTADHTAQYTTDRSVWVRQKAEFEHRKSREMAASRQSDDALFMAIALGFGTAALGSMDIPSDQAVELGSAFATDILTNKGGTNMRQLANGGSPSYGSHNAPNGPMSDEELWEKLDRMKKESGLQDTLRQAQQQAEHQRQEKYNLQMQQWNQEMERINNNQTQYVPPQSSYKRPQENPPKLTKTEARPREVYQDTWSEKLRQRKEECLARGRTWHSDSVGCIKAQTNYTPPKPVTDDCLDSILECRKTCTDKYWGEMEACNNIGASGNCPNLVQRKIDKCGTECGDRLYLSGVCTKKDKAAPTATMSQ